jgi:hypothetical protein
MTRLLPFLLLLDCGSIVPQSVRTPSDECREASDIYIGTHAAAVALSALAGGTAAGTVLSASLADEPWADVGLALGGTVLGAGAVLLQTIADSYAQRAAQVCGED